jgi:hypothetical protein
MLLFDGAGWRGAVAATERCPLGRGDEVMRSALATLVVLFAAVAHGQDDAPKATGRLEGKPVMFPQKEFIEGVKATLGLLQSCHSSSVFEADELKKALQGDHIRWVFPKAIVAKVMNEKIAFSELVFRLPLNTGVFWVRNGDKWRRYSKYEVQKEKPFVLWLREARPAQ